MVQGWWANLLQGAVSAVIGGAVAALTAWAVVSATRRHERRFAMEREARTAALNLFVMLGEIHTNLTRAAKDGLTLPRMTESRDWGLTVLTAEVAMFSLDRKTGVGFSQAMGDLRRALESIEGVERPDPALVERAASAWQKLVDRLADWLMEGRHHDSDAPLGNRPSESASRQDQQPNSTN